jgi:Zn-dependent peptidase ImmA (M78 family)
MGKLLRSSTALRESIIAHELAHLVLGHEETPSSNALEEAEKGEREADALVQS